MSVKPIRSMYLPYGKQWIDEEDINAVIDVLKGDYLTTGPALGGFEKAVAEYVGAKYAVAFSNGTAALHGACFAANIGIGDEVITTPMTFAASANCVLYQGGTPVFADIDERTYNIDPKEIEKKIVEEKNIFPDANRTYQENLGSMWMFGKYRVDLTLGYGESGKTLVNSSYVWVIPVTLITIIVFLILIISLVAYLISRKVKERQEQLEEKLEQEISEIEALKNKFKDKLPK